MVCKNGDAGLDEVKCPYSARDMTIAEAVNGVKDFCLEKDDENIRLKKNTHNYFFQVQGQLLVTGAKFCDFVVYTKKDLFIERIVPDNATMIKILEKLCSFFVEHFKPFLQKSN